jgi:hypothetical protein
MRECFFVILLLLLYPPFLAGGEISCENFSLEATLASRHAGPSDEIRFKISLKNRDKLAVFLPRPEVPTQWTIEAEDITTGAWKDFLLGGIGRGYPAGKYRQEDYVQVEPASAYTKESFDLTHALRGCRERIRPGNYRVRFYYVRTPFACESTLPVLECHLKSGWVYFTVSEE